MNSERSGSSPTENRGAPSRAPLPAMLEIYAIPTSLYCAKLRIALRHKQLEWREVPPPGGYGSPRYREIVASGNLPAMRDGDLLLADSEAILEYLEERHPLPAMMPAGPAHRARVRELSRFHDTRLEPELRKLFPYIAPDRRDDAITAAQAGQLNMRLQQLAIMLAQRPHAGGTLTLADCGFPVSFLWIERLAPQLGFAIDWPDEVIAYRRNLARLPAVAAEIASYEPVVEEWLAMRTQAR